MNILVSPSRLISRGLTLLTYQIVKCDFTLGVPVNIPKVSWNSLAKFFLTENNLAIAVIATQPIAFKDRHEYTPMQRFTSAFINDTDLKRLKQLLETK